MEWMPVVEVSLAILAAGGGAYALNKLRNRMGGGSSQPDLQSQMEAEAKRQSGLPRGRDQVPQGGPPPPSGPNTGY